MKKNNYGYFEKYLKFIDLNNLYPEIHTVDGFSADPIVNISGKEYLSFSTNNYLSLAKDNRILKAVSDALPKYGVGSGSTRLLSGTLDIQIEFEKRLAKFFGYDNAITFSSGFLANVGVIRMLVDAFPYFKLPFLSDNGVILSDELNHASIVDAVRLSKSDRFIYRHNDLDHLESLLKEYKNSRKLVITDGIFSMDGTEAKIFDLVNLCNKYNALLFVDDSHGVGVLGKKGRGVIEQLNTSDYPSVLMGSFTKAFGSLGGFVCINETLDKYLRITARSYIFSDPIPPILVAGLMEALNIIENEEDRRNRALSNANYLRNGFKQMNLKVLGDNSTIVPLIIGNEKKAMKFARKLFDNDILAPCIRKPAVKEGSERIRFCVTTNHNREQLDKLLSISRIIAKDCGLN